MLVDLQSQLDAETKKGNLDGALAIRAEISRLKEPDKEIDGDDKLVIEAKKILTSSKWRIKVLGTPYKADWTFSADGTIVRKGDDNSEGKWSIENRGKSKVLRVSWGPDAGGDEFPFPLNATRLNGANFPSNQRTELTKLPNK